MGKEPVAHEASVDKEVLQVGARACCLDAASAITGRTIRARMFQTPDTMAEVEIARPEKPHDRHIANVAANPTAPPPGSRLLTDEPAMLTMNARQWLRPGMEPVRVNV